MSTVACCITSATTSFEPRIRLNYVVGTFGQVLEWGPFTVNGTATANARNLTGSTVDVTLFPPFNGTPIVLTNVGTGRSDGIAEYALAVGNITFKGPWGVRAFVNIGTERLPSEVLVVDAVER